MTMLRSLDVSRVSTSELTHVNAVCLQVNYLTFRWIHAEELVLEAVRPDTLVVQPVKDTIMATAILTQLQLFVDGVDSGLDVIAILLHMQML